jgi:iron complex outermembrane receptor protein
MLRIPGALLVATSAMAISAGANAQVTPPPQTGNDAITGSTAGDVGSQAGGASSAPSDQISASQGTAPPAAAQPDATGLGEIVVTAQRRAENLTSVPLSISAQTGATLSAAGIKQLSEVKFTTPGFISSAGVGYTQIYIRGIGNGVFVGADPSIATFIDDVPHVYGSLVEDLVNVERVEILKGAQGGLYGRNASGGVINIITKQPSDKFSALMRVTGGKYGTLQASAYVNMPLNDRIAVNFSLTRNQHKPYLKNVAYKNPYPANATNVFGENLNSLSNPGPINKQNLWSFDSKLRVKLGDRAKVTLGVDYTDKRDSDGNGWLDRDPAASYGTYKYLMTLFAPTVIPIGCTALPVFTPGNCPSSPPWPKLSKKSSKVYGAYAYASDTEDYGASGKVEVNTDFADLTSITAFRWNNSHFQGDVGAAPVPIAGFSTHFKRRFFYQELRAVSNGSGPFRWLGGATYFKDHVDVSIASILVGHFLPPTVSQFRTVNYSIYGQGSYDITDKLSFQASLRYANEKKTVTFPNPTISDTTKVHKFIPAATLSYKVSGGVIYARYAKGFKTGGPNPLVRPDRLPAGSAGLTLKPETVDTFEVGYRATLFDRKVQFTSAIFYNKYKNIHVTTSGTAPSNTDISNALINLGTARTYGAEASIVWRVIPPVTLSLNGGYLNAKYQKAVFAGSSLLIGLNSSGNTMILAPKWQGGAQINLDQPLNDSTRLKANLLYSYISKHYFVATEREQASQKAYSLVNIRGGVTLMNDRLGLYVFVNNVFETRYYVAGSGSTPGSLTFSTLGTPRIFGGTVEVKF